MNQIIQSSGNEVIDNFIRYTQTKNTKSPGKMEFVPYERFVNVEFIAEGGFSKVYKATWTTDGPNNLDVPDYCRMGNKIVALKELYNSKNITSEQLNEVQFYTIILIVNMA